MDDKKLRIALDKYYERFDDAFPMMEYRLSDKDALKFINRCLNENKKASDIKPLRGDVNY